jgi:Ser-tRNA(Ala) deacylase AlaX
MKAYDAPMHTAEHILNQAMTRRFACGRSINAHIERRKSKCDYRLDRPLSEAETRAIEAEVNRVIGENLPVTEELVTRGAAEREYFTGKLPANASGPIRIVKVGDYDACPCIGPHVESTGEIPAFRIASVSHAGDTLRIRFTLAADAEKD